MVGVEAGDDRYGVPFPDECRHKGEGEHDAPDADDVHAKDVFCIPSAADDSRIGGHLIRRANAGHRENEQKSVGEIFGFVAYFVCRDYGSAEQKDGEACQNSDADEYFLRFG